MTVLAAPTTGAGVAPTSTPATTEIWGFTLTQPSATVIAGLLAVAAALLAFTGVFIRRAQTERHWRLTSRRARYTDVAEQLAHANPAVRNAGVYAMEALANDWLTWQWWTRSRHRQTGRKEAQACIDVLCAYLRLPYTPPPDGVTTTKQIFTTTRGGIGKSIGPRVETHHEYRHDDRQVRASIVNVIATNLRVTPPHATRWKLLVRWMFARRKSPWGQLNYNLSGAEFHEPVPMSGIVVSGTWDMTGATFHQLASFRNATFHGIASFPTATFHQLASFPTATFRDRAEFYDATFRDRAEFYDATFRDRAEFNNATFRRTASFSDATFRHTAEFNDASFRDHAEFRVATFRHTAAFPSATFRRTASFRGATFRRKASFGGATFHQPVRFRGATFHGNVGFGDATFQDTAWFANATFQDTAWFDDATFHQLTEFDDPQNSKWNARFGPGLVGWEVAVVGESLIRFDGARCPWPRR